MHRVRLAASIVGLLIPLARCWADGPKKVSKDEALEAVVSKVQPTYPPMARQFNIEGGVELEAVISESGVVDAVNIVSGNPVLTKPAAEALKKWKFKPFTEGGKAVSALAPFHFTFKKPS